MAAIGTVIINDGAATPVAHTFSPVGINSDNVAFWDDRSPAFPVGFNALSASLRKPNTGSGAKNYKAQLKLVLPTLEVGTTVPTKAYDMLATVEFVMPQQGTLQNRKDLYALLKNAISHATFKALVEDLENVY